MDWRYLSAALAFATLIAAFGIAYLSKRRVEKRMDDAQARKSELEKERASGDDPPEG